MSWAYFSFIIFVHTTHFFIGFYYCTYSTTVFSWNRSSTGHASWTMNLNNVSNIGAPTESQESTNFGAVCKCFIIIFIILIAHDHYSNLFHRNVSPSNKKWLFIIDQIIWSHSVMIRNKQNVISLRFMKWNANVVDFFAIPLDELGVTIIMRSFCAI